MFLIINSDQLQLTFFLIIICVFDEVYPLTRNKGFWKTRVQLYSIRIIYRKLRYPNVSNNLKGEKKIG